MYLGFCIHDVIYDDTGDTPIATQVIYVDFDLEDEADEFGYLAAKSDRLHDEIERLANKAVENIQGV